MTFGLAYAVFNQNKDDTKPMWIVGLDWEVPSAEQLNPSVNTTLSSRGKIGDRTHKYTLFTAFSKRLSFVEPYFRFGWTIPYRGPGWYSNCDSSVGMSYPANCGTETWSRSDAGIRMPHILSLQTGMELVLDEDREAGQKFAFDLRALSNFYSEGRYQNELTDVLGKMLATQDYLQLGGSFGVIGKPAKFFSLRASAALLYSTEHTLTDESIGRDSPADADTRVSVPTSANVPAPEVNPTFDFRTDMVSRRFRAVDNYVFVVDITASFDF
jgi:hypothetical protein